jgi:hypothetical protein
VNLSSLPPIGEGLEVDGKRTNKRMFKLTSGRGWYMNSGESDQESETGRVVLRGLLISYKDSDVMLYLLLADSNGFPIKLPSKGIFEIWFILTSDQHV